MFNSFWKKKKKINTKFSLYFRKKISLARVLFKNPTKKSIVKRVIITTPRKPNSARRKTVKTSYKAGKCVLSYVPGGAHSLKRFSNIMVRGKGARDLPGIYTHTIRGCYDLIGLLNRNKRRSIYGAKKN